MQAGGIEVFHITSSLQYVVLCNEVWERSILWWLR